MRPFYTVLICSFILLIGVQFSNAQSDRGKIIKPGSSVLDPNGDGFVSKTTAGFSFDGYYVDEFEQNMFGIPKLGGDVTGDNIGKSCGITDLIPDSSGYSVYALRDASNNLIFRFRVGDSNPSVEAWTILLDIDGLFGPSDPDANPENPGFEIDITLIKNPNMGVWVYNINGEDNCPLPLTSYPLETHFQISIADEVSCGDPDYFYDIYVPFSEIAALFGIDENTGLRYAAVTNVSATCAMAGKISDISGVDYDDYPNNAAGAFLDLVLNQCPTAVVDLCETCTGFTKQLVQAPTIDTPVRAGQEFISGAAEPGVFIIVEIFSRTGGTDESPTWSSTARETQTTTVDGAGAWVVPLTDPLQAYDRIVATAQIDENSVPCISNGDNTSSTSVTVVQPNTPPVADDDLVEVPEDTPTPITLTGSDPEGDPITFTVLTQPSHGTLTGVAPNLTYTPAANYNGPDSFTFKVDDGIYDSDPATITIDVTPINDAPSANNQSVMMDEDTTLPITLTGNDIDGDLLLYSVQTLPANGILGGSGANLTYTPNLNFNGQDSFTFVVNDGLVNSNLATITITVKPVNDAPAANNQSLSVDEDTALPIMLTGTDVDGNTLTYEIVGLPANGTLSGSGANRTYTPAPDFNGNDSFTFKVTDGLLESNVATISITVNPVNDLPVAHNQALTVAEDGSLPITLTATDVDGDILTFSVQSMPTNGLLTGTAPNLTYTPNSNFNGSDSFTFVANDDDGSSNVATITITVTPEPDAPTANPQLVITDEDTPVDITLEGTDPDGQSLTYIIVSLPSNGTLSGMAPNVTYSPNADYFGADSFTFKINDGFTDSNVATVDITVNSVNDAPIADNQNVEYTIDTPTPFTLTGSDLEGDPLTFIVLTQPAHGTLSGTEPNLTYTPDPGYDGADSFTFKVNDGNDDSNVATVNFSPAPITNTDPIANDQNVEVFEDMAKAIILTATDPDPDNLTYIILTPPSNGTLTGAVGSPNRTYTPALNYNGPDSFTFKVNDGTSDSNTGTVTINVVPRNDAPVANSQSVSVNEDTSIGITLTGSDIDVGDVLTYSIVAIPTHGTLSVLSGPNGNQVTYTPSANYHGSDSFTFRVNDGMVNSPVATVSITVNSINDLPVAVNDSRTTNEDTPTTFNILANDSDIDGVLDATTIVLSQTSVPGGTFSVGAGGSITFTPALNFNGAVTVITYTVKDNQGGTSNSASIAVTVNPVNDAPVPDGDEIFVMEDGDTTYCVTFADVENDPAVISEVVGVHGNGTVVIDPVSGDLCFVYTPNPDFNGDDEVVVTICDANDGTVCNSGTIIIHVTPENDPPVIVVDGNVITTFEAETEEDTPVDFCFVAEDIDGDITHLESYTMVSGGGTLTPQASGVNEYCFTFEPDPDFNGESVWTATICDDGGLCAELSIVITVNPVNDVPIAYDQSLTILEDDPTAPIAITLQATDVETDPLNLNYIIVEAPKKGTLTAGANTNVRMYTPALNKNGVDTFKFKVNDGQDDSNIATVTINITPVNDAPILTNVTVLAWEDSVKQVCVSFVDADENDVVTIAEATPVNGCGTLTFDPDLDFCYIFTPDPNYNGESKWTVKACDQDGACGTAMATIILRPVNDSPVAVDDYVEQEGGATVTYDVLANDSPIEPPFQEFYDIYEADSTDVLTIYQVQPLGVQQGTATIVDNMIEYTPSGPNRIDSVRYWIVDSGGLIDSAVLYIEVGPLAFRIYEGLSPNGDNLNDHWQIDGIEQDPTCLVRVFDRFNNLVFEKQGYDNEQPDKRWIGQSNHGLFQNDLPEGTYYYTISIDLANDTKGSRLYSGFVFLKRN